MIVEPDFSGLSPAEFLSDFEKKVVETTPNLSMEKMLKRKVELIGQQMVYLWGAKMFEISRDYARTLETVGWLCSFASDEFRATGLGTDPGTVRAILTRGTAFSESLVTLNRLCALDTERTALLVFELRSDMTSTCMNIEFSANGITKPPLLYARLNYQLETMPEERQVHKWICAACLTTEIDTALSKCSACQYARYCSTDCQKQNWDFHKPRCPLLARLIRH